MNTPTITRLNKYISEKGICSRREADKYIENGAVFVNGKRAKLGDKVKPGDKVMINGQKLEQVEQKEFILLALNKPVGIVSTAETNTKDNIVKYVNHSDRVFPIGRLDKDSQGLIFLTNNGDIVNEILRAGNKHEKEYLVTVDNTITDQFLAGMAQGVPILGKMTKKCTVTRVTPFIFRIVLIQGMNRQIRRMCEHFGYGVKKLERVRIMNITLKGIPLGDWRQLEEDEVAQMMQMIEESGSKEKPHKTRQKPFKAKYGKEERRIAASKSYAGRKRASTGKAAEDGKDTSKADPKKKATRAKGKYGEQEASSKPFTEKRSAANKSESGGKSRYNKKSDGGAKGKTDSRSRGSGGRDSAPRKGRSFKR